MIKLFKLLGKRGLYLIAACIALVSAQVWLDLTMPDYMSDITRLVVTEGSNMADIWAAGAKMLLCTFGSAATSVVVGYIAARMSADLGYNIRSHVFSKVSDFGAGEIKKFSTASLITRTTNDITQITMMIAMGLQMMIKAPIMAVWAVLKIVGKSWELSLTAAGAIVIIVITLTFLMVTVLPKFKIIQKQIDNVGRVIRENLTGLRVVRAFNAEKYQEDKFEDASVSLMKTQLFTARRMAVLQPVMGIVMSGLSLAIYWLGASMVNAITVTGMAAIQERVALFSNVVVFSSYAMYVVMSFMMLIMIFMLLPRAQVSAKRINEVLDSPFAVKEGKVTSSEDSGTVEFRNVSFRYPDASEECLRNISFKAEKGETVAVIGSTGSGKTTLLELTARLYDASAGEVLIDGVNVKDYTFAALYDKLGYVSQKAILFSDTVENNVAFGASGRTALSENVTDAIDIAQGADFVQKMPGNLKAEIAQSGTNISGGQKQRLSIARAIARRPEILIFDDSFSALDFMTDKKLRGRLAEDLKGTTCLIVAQRIGSIRNADKIVVLDDGAMAGIGTHEELMKNCEVYKEIALSQLSAKELGVKEGAQ